MRESKYQMKNLFQNSFSLDQKKPSLARVSEKWKKLTFASQNFANPEFQKLQQSSVFTQFPLYRKPVFTSRNE